jgi:hypothetical protein
MIGALHSNIGQQHLIATPTSKLHEIQGYMDQLDQQLAVSQACMIQFDEIAKKHAPPNAPNRFTKFSLVCDEPSCPSYWRKSQPVETGDEHFRTFPEHVRLKDLTYSHAGRAYDTMTRDTYLEACDLHAKHMVVLQTAKGKLEALQTRLEAQPQDEEADTSPGVGPVRKIIFVSEPEEIDTAPMSGFEVCLVQFTCIMHLHV